MPLILQSSTSSTFSPSSASPSLSLVSSSNLSSVFFTPEETGEEVLSLFSSVYSQAYGSDGEEMTQFAHALQAAELAEQTGADEATIIAALLHDVGHMVLSKPDSWSMIEAQKEEQKQLEEAKENDKSKREEAEEAKQRDWKSEQHEWVGLFWLQKHGFSLKVQDLVLGHVSAKRYLTFKDPAYHDSLSAASKMTLIGQGGPMTAEEASEFEQSEWFEAKLNMRRWDEGAKLGPEQWHEREGQMQQYCDMIVRHLSIEKERSKSLH